VSPNVRVVLREETEILEEVVVTALGITREKKALGYAVQELEADELVQAANNNLTTAFARKSFWYRSYPIIWYAWGFSKVNYTWITFFTGDNTPLYVLMECLLLQPQI